MSSSAFDFCCADLHFIGIIIIFVLQAVLQ